MSAPTIDAGTSLAASVLAAFGTVRRQLEETRPRVGRVEQQARSAFGDVQDRWVQMASDDLAGVCDADRVTVIAEAIGEVVNADAAQGLAAGMDVQLAKGWAPEVAWQRALVGYGLGEREMNRYLAAVMGVKTEVAKTVVPPSAAVAVQRALDAHARAVAADGVAVAAACGKVSTASEVDKAFDPDQARDPGGRWTAGAAAGRKRQPAVAATAVRDDTVGQMLAGVSDEQEAPTATPANPYASLIQPVNPYAGLAQGNPYASLAQPANPYESLIQPVNPYAGLEQQAPDPYLQAQSRPKPKRTLILLVPGRAPTADDRKLVVNEAQGGGFFLPQRDLEKYFKDDILQGGSGGSHGMHSVIDFARIHRFQQDDPLQDDKRIGAQYSSNIWHVAASPEQFEDVSDDSWYDLMEQAHPLWEEAQSNPVAVADALGGADLMDIAALAGYPLASPTAIKAEVARQVSIRDDGRPRTEDEADTDFGLLDALADYAVWRQPKVLVENGLVGEDADEFASTLRDNDLSDAFDTASTPTVMFFRSFDGADDDDRSDLNGRYMGEAVVYRSAMRERTWTSPGVIGARELILERDKLRRV